MFRNSLYRFSPPYPMPGDVMPTNIDFIEVKPDKSIVISNSINFPGEEIFKKTYIIEKLSHIEIALKVLSGGISAKDGTRDLCQNEQLPDEYDAQQFPLGELLASMPGNKKIRYIDSNMQEKLKEHIGLGNDGAMPLVSTLFNSIKTQKNVRFKELLTSIVEGNLDKVKMMIERDASLLLEKLDENDYVTALSGQRSNNATAYRTALAVEDTQMAAWIKNKLFELAGNDDAANTQYREQFPDGWEADEAKRWAPVFTTLDSLKVAIQNAKPGDIRSSGDSEYKLTVREGSDVAVVLAQFRSQLDARLNEVVTTGRHFNPDLLLKAFQMYDDHFQNDFRNDSTDDPREMLFYQQVIGTIQRVLPVNYVQAFCDNLCHIEEKLRDNIPQGRSLKIDLYENYNRWVPTDFYPLRTSRLGFDYAIGAVAIGSDTGMARAGAARVFEAYINQKQRACKNLYPDAKTLEGFAPVAR